MAFLNGLFAFLCVIFFICLIVGLIKPSIFKLKSRLKAFLIFFVAMIVSSIVVSVTMSDEQKAQIAKDEKIAQVKREAEEKAEAKQEALDKQKAELEIQAKTKKDDLAKQQTEIEKKEALNSDKSLGLTVEQFRTKLNDEIIQADLETVKPLKQLKVEGGVFKVENLANKDMGLVGNVNKNGEIKSLVYIVGAINNSDDVATAMIYPGLTAKILSPEIQTEKKTKTLIKLMTKAAEGIDKKENFHEETVGDISYYSTASKNMGLWIGFEAKD